MNGSNESNVPDLPSQSLLSYYHISCYISVSILFFLLPRRLMYTNSEMFEFYHGLTGFANVFPTAKFEDLSLQYTSDGYLNEGDNEIFDRKGDRKRVRRKRLRIP